MAQSKPLNTIIRERRATPHFDGAPIPDSDLDAILEAGRHAPSGYNLQPWRFLVLRSADRKAALRRAAYDQAKITEASVVVVVFARREEWKQTAPEVFAESVKRGVIPAEKADKARESGVGFVEKLDRAMWLNRHCMIAFTHLMLMAESLGYDTAPMEGFDAAAVRRELALPDDAEVVALLAIGHLQGADKGFAGRLPLARIAFDDRPDRPWGAPHHDSRAPKPSAGS